MEIGQNKNLAMEALVPRLTRGEKIAADLGYRDGYRHFFTAFPDSGTTDVMRGINWDLKLMKARHESINARFKTFESLNTRLFRHGREFHPVVFTAIANLVQWTLKEEPLWEFIPTQL